MADLHNILSKFNELGIVNKGLTVETPTVPQQPAQSNNDVDPNSHARMVAESVRGKHIPGVSDVSATDFAALAGVKSTSPTTRPSPATPNPNSYATNNFDSNHLNSIEQRLTSIENRLQSIFESVQRLAEISDEDYRAKRKALQDIQMDPNTAKDPDLKKELVRRTARLEKEREESKRSTSESLESEFQRFLEEVERGK